MRKKCGIWQKGWLFGRFLGHWIIKNENSDFETQLRVFRTNDRTEFLKQQKAKIVDWNYEQVLQLFNQTTVAADEFPQDENKRPILTTALSSGLEELLSHARKAVTVVKRQQKKIIARRKKLRNYYIDKTESSHFHTAKRRVEIWASGFC